MAKLWQKNYDIDGLIERFTVGDDYILDASLVPADCVASIAHAVMLTHIGVLARDELASLKKELAGILSLHSQGKFTIGMKDEDCHTAIENHLVEKLGDAGKKIHTGRSRNDQVNAALRVYGRSSLFEIRKAMLELASTLSVFARANEHVPMPGRTHMQIAMPSSVGLWAGAFAEALLDDLLLVETAGFLIDSNPLGAAAGYGVSLPLDREMVRDLLGFGRVQNNVIYVNNSRGKYESIALDALDQVCLTLGKLATDIILFSLPEFGYFTLPRELTTGSSIMPQKKNPDGLELVRAKAGTISGYATQTKNIVRSLPSGYNRDFQETKRPFMLGLSTAFECIVVMNLTISKLGVDAKRLSAAFTPEIFATDAAYELVKKGTTFRDAYKEVGASLDSLEAGNPAATIRAKTYAGTAGNLGLDAIDAACREKLDRLTRDEALIREKLRALSGMDVAVTGIGRP